MIVAAIAAAGALGALARFGMSMLVGPRAHAGFPWSTFVVNVSGSFVLGLVAAFIGGRVPREVHAAVTIGFLGAYTTFSTFSLETVHLVEEGALLVAVANVVASVAAAGAAVYLGTVIGRVA